MIQSTTYLTPIRIITICAPMTHWKRARDGKTTILEKLGVKLNVQAMTTRVEQWPVMRVL